MNQHFGTLQNGLRVLNFYARSPITFDDGTILQKYPGHPPRFKTIRNVCQEFIHLENRNISIEGLSCIRCLHDYSMRKIEEVELSNEIDIILVHLETLRAIFNTREHLGLCRAPVFLKDSKISSSTFQRR